MIEKYDRKRHGDVTYNKNYYFLWDGSQVWASDSWTEIQSMSAEMMHGCVLHHSSLRRSYEFGGYVPVAETRVWPYKGRFGQGYITIENYSAQYVTVGYWIREAA